MSDAVKQVLDKLQALADKLGVAVTHVWSFYVRQAHIEAISYGVAVLISVVLCVWLIPCAIKAMGEYIYNRAEEGSFDGAKPCSANQAKRLMKFWFAAAFSLVCILIFLTSFNTFITCLLNPDYTAFQDLLNTIR